MLKRSSEISRCWVSFKPQTSTCTCSASVGKKALTSSPIVKSGKSVSCSAPAIESWSVSVTWVMPRALASR